MIQSKLILTCLYLSKLEYLAQVMKLWFQIFMIFWPIIWFFYQKQSPLLKNVGTFGFVVLELIYGSSECNKSPWFWENNLKISCKLLFLYAYLICLLKVWVKKESVVTWKSIFRFELRIMSHPFCKYFRRPYKYKTSQQLSAKNLLCVRVQLRQGS